MKATARAWGAEDDGAGIGGGRPFHQRGEALQAPTPSDDGWSRLAAAEHASIAAFARLQLDLMALGAPLDLLQAVSSALDDEVRHARLALQQAHAHADGVGGLGRFPFRTPVHPTRDPVTLAVCAVREGCIGETLAAAALRRAAELTDDPEQARILTLFADDEDRHVLLSWKVVAWAVEIGGQPVCDAVRQAFTNPLPPLDFPLLDRAELDEIRRVVPALVIGPAARALLDPACLPPATLPVEDPCATPFST